MSSGMADALGRPIRPLDVLLVDGALGPLHRLLPGGPGLRLTTDLARRPRTAVRRVRDLGGVSDQARRAELLDPADVEVVDTQYPIEGAHRAFRLYRPPADGPLPVVVFLHGGGWIGGSLDSFDEPCATLARNAGAFVVSPDYRLAPEHPFPAAIDDTVAVLRWAADHIDEFGGDPERIAVGGESAGANLATVAALRVRDEGGPELRAQVLVSSLTDLLADKESRRLFSRGPIISNELGAQGRLRACAGRGRGPDRCAVDLTGCSTPRCRCPPRSRVRPRSRLRWPSSSCRCSRPTTEARPPSVS
jgi:acetyl esterase/lipase